MSEPASVPSAEQLAHLIGHADHRPLTPVEAAALRAGVADLHRRLAAATAVTARRTNRARLAEARIALALAVLDGTPPDDPEHLAHEIRGALTMPAPEAQR